MFEIWRHVGSGARYLVVVRDGMVNLAAGPLRWGEDPCRVLETHSNQEHNPMALLHIRRAPQEYVREYTTDRDGRAVPVEPPPTS